MMRTSFLRLPRLLLLAAALVALAVLLPHESPPARPTLPGMLKKSSVVPSGSTSRRSDALAQLSLP